MAVIGDYAYLGDGTSFRVIDVSVPATPSEIWSRYVSSNCEGMTTQGNYVFVACGQSGLVVFHVADPTNPALVGYYRTGDYSMGVAVSGNQVYVGDDASGVFSLEFTPPPTPVFITAFEARNAVSGLCLP